MNKNPNNRKKSQQLGMPYGTACGRLRKTILFTLLRDVGKNICFRCGKEILSEDDLSIDHKVSWIDNDPALFWDVSNIAFSHLSCNVAASRSNPANKVSCADGYFWCSGCKRCLPGDNFHNNKNYWSGKHHYCKACRYK